MAISLSNILRIAFAAIMLLVSTASFAQYKIQLSKIEGRDAVKFIYKGYKITYKMDGQPLKSSRIKEITSDFIVTTEDTFALSDLDFIAYQKPLSQLMKLGAQVTYYGSFGMLVVAYYAYTRLPMFPQVGTVLAAMGFVPLVISRQIIARDDYALFDLHYQWNAEIVSR